MESDSVCFARRPLASRETIDISSSKHYYTFDHTVISLLSIDYSTVIDHVCSFFLAERNFRLLPRLDYAKLIREIRACVTGRFRDGPNPTTRSKNEAYDDREPAVALLLILGARIRNTGILPSASRLFFARGFAKDAGYHNSRDINFERACRFFAARRRGGRQRRGERERELE